MTIYQMGIEAVENGVPVTINIEKRTMHIGKRKVIDGRLYSPLTKLAFDFGDSLPNLTCHVLLRIAADYRVYKHSIPGKNEPSRPWFKALKYDQLTDEDRLLGVDRAEARFELEYDVLVALITGKLRWVGSEMGYRNWFWKNSDGLVILRSWIEPSIETNIL